MKHTIKTRNRLTSGAALLFLSLGASAQSLPFDGFTNDPLGGAALAVVPGGGLVVSNIGSSGQDGVSITVPSSQGGGVSFDLSAGPNDSFAFSAEVAPGGVPPVGVSLPALVDALGDTNFVGDFTGLGQSTYGLRLYQDGQVVYDQSGQSGLSRISSAGPGSPIIEFYVYVGDRCIICVRIGGTSSQEAVHPASGGSFDADFMEIYSDPIGSADVSSVQLTAAGPPSFTVHAEQGRYFDHWLNGLDAALLVPSLAGTGGLVVSNIGSSGLDGVRIESPQDTDHTFVAIDPLDAANNPGAQMRALATAGSGEVSPLLLDEVGGEWLMTPQFGPVSAPTYELRLFNQGQMVYSENDKIGPAGLARFIFEITHYQVTRPNGEVCWEWCVIIELGPGGSSTTTFRVAGGPTLLVDMVTFSSGTVTASDSVVDSLSIVAADLTEALVLNSLTSLSSPECLGTSYCVAAVNSTGVGASMCSFGSASVSTNNLVLRCTDLPHGQFGIFYYGPNQIQFPFGNGFRCVGGSVYRLPILSSGPTGTLIYAVDNTHPPQLSGQIHPGSTWNFQCWYRDPAGAGAAHNLSDGHSIQFTL